MHPSTSTDMSRKSVRSRHFRHAGGFLLQAWLLCFAPVLAFALAPARATAQEATPAPIKVVVLPFSGPTQSAERARAQVLKALGKKYEIVPQETWDQAMQKQAGAANPTEGLIATARDLGVQVIVTGSIKREKNVWMLAINVRQGATGQSIEKKAYVLRSPSLTQTAARGILTDIPPLVDKVGAIPPPPPPKPSEPPLPALPEDTENPLLFKPKPKAQPKRPAWAPYFDISAAFELSGRRFGFQERGQPEFRSVLSPGLRVDVNIYPLAGLSKREGNANRFVQGLGFGATLDYIFWPDSVVCANRDANGNCLNPGTERYATQERRIEAGLRWRWSIVNRATSPDLLINAQYGQHLFSIAKLANGQDVGPPDVTYQYLTVGAGLRIPVHPVFALLANFNYHIVFNTGSIHTDQEYGSGGAWGLRAHVGGEVRIWRGLIVRVAGFYERFGLSFDNSAVGSNGLPVKITTGNATDQYYGLWGGLGYVF
ncbi:MAG TPA: hypothetical protein VH877_07910 [Polyangia bacterium]|nr:hypothetical protein [Polyangia bacterium]